MVVVIVRCKRHGNPSRFVVHENTAYIGYMCAECEADVLIDVEPERLPPSRPASDEGAPG
jgi:hypothetical protein